MSRARGSNVLSLTPSKVRDYQACPQQYKLKVNTPRVADRTTASLSFGNSIHAALEELHMRVIPGNQVADCAQILRRHWKAGDYGDNQESEQYFDRGLKALNRYMEVVGRTVGRVVGTELYLSRTVRLETERVRLGCKVDRLELHPDGVLEILDYKTNAGGQVPTPEFLKDDLATFIYYVLVRLTYPESHRVVVSQLNVMTLAKVKIEYESIKIGVHKKGLLDLVRSIGASEFDPRPSSACSWCRVRDFCPAFGPDSDLEELT